MLRMVTYRQLTLSISQHALQNLCADTSTLLEQIGLTLDGMYCDRVQGHSAQNRVGYFRRIIDERIKRENFTAVQADCPQNIFFINVSEEDSLPDASLLDLVDDNQEDEVRTTVDEMIYKAPEGGFPK